MAPNLLRVATEQIVLLRPASSDASRFPQPRPGVGAARPAWGACKSQGQSLRYFINLLH